MKSGRRSATVPAAALAGAVLLASVLSCSRAEDAPGAGELPVAAATGNRDATPLDAAQVPGVSAGRILFGQSAAFSGPAQELGRNLRLGIEAAFQEANRRGGVHGRRLELISRDDALRAGGGLTRWRRYAIFSALLFARWCNGSTTDSGSVRRGSNPCRAATLP